MPELNFRTIELALLLPVGAAAVSALLTLLCVKLLPKLGFIDLPDSRRVHHKPIPRGGGIAIIAAFFAGGAVLAACSSDDGIKTYLLDLSLPAGIILLVGLLDDRFSLNAKVKLLFQIAAGFLVWWSPLHRDPERLHDLIVALPPWASCLVTVFLVVAIINAFNLIDGLDGLAAGLSVVSAICLTAWAAIISRRLDLMIMYLILAGGCVGFLKYNFYPARIFMGDTGSNFLGLFFAVGCINSMTGAATTVAVFVPLMAVGVPIFDVFLATWRRLIRRLGDHGHGSGVMSADLDHLHHRIFARNHDQRKTAMALYLFACALALAGVAVMVGAHRSAAFGYVVVLLVIVLAVRKFATVELNASAKMALKGLHKPHRNFLFIITHPLYDLCCVFAAHILTNLLLRTSPLNLWMASLPYMMVFYVTLLFSGIYKIYWFRTGLRDYRVLVETLFFASLLAIFANRIFGGPWTMGRGVMFLMLANSAIMGERLMIRYVEGFMLRQIFVRRRAGDDDLDSVVIFGGGQGCRTFLSSTAYTYKDIFSVLGIVDDDRSLHGLRLYGYKVLGGRGDLESLYARRPFQRMIVTSYRISDETVAELVEFAARHDIKILRFHSGTVDISKKDAAEG